MKMTRFDKDTLLDCLPIHIYNALINALNKDSAWITLANCVAEQLEYPRALWIQSLKEAKEPNNSPGERLLFELNIKMCTVEILRTLLDDCNLLNILSIISDLEPLKIITHPTEELQTDNLGIGFGKRLQLFCNAVGMPPPTYTWYHNDKELKTCTSSKLDILINSASQAGEYKCKVFQTKYDGTLISTLTSKVVIVEIFPIPVTIEQQPQPWLEVKNGESFTISCKASGYPEPTYQWFQDNTKLEAEISNTLHVKEFNSKLVGNYYCYICNNVSEIYTQSSRITMQLPRLKAAAKVALIIANETYKYQEKDLPITKNDAAYLGRLLKTLDFKVICLIDLTIAEMRNAIKVFSSLLGEGVYGLFYFAGHGFKMQENHMVAVDTPEVYLRKDSICESELLAAFLKNDPELLIIILDMCQTLPSKEFNPDIYNEVPIVNEYRSKKNLRNLVQAYSTSSHRPSYDRQHTSEYGLYMTHLSKYIDKDIPVTNMFEEVGKSIDSCFKGKERNQIPMFAVSITKPFRLTDEIQRNNVPAAVKQLIEVISFPTETLDITFRQANISCKLTVSPFLDPYLNVAKVTVHNIDDFELNVTHSCCTETNNLHVDQQKKEYRIHNPQVNEEALVISIHKNGTKVDSTMLYIEDYMPPLLYSLKD